MNDSELDREMNLRYFGSEPAVNYGDVGAAPGDVRDRGEPPEEEEPSRYGIRIVYPDGLENDVDFGTMLLRIARTVAEHARENLAHSVFEARVVIVNLDTGRIIDEETP